MNENVANSLTMSMDSVPSKVFELGPILTNLTKLEGFLDQNH